MDKDDPNFVIKDITDFHMKASTVHLTGQDYLIVDERVYKAIGRGVVSNYLTYGNPGVKVYLEGTKESCDINDAKTIY